MTSSHTPYDPLDSVGVPECSGGEGGKEKEKVEYRVGRLGRVEVGCELPRILDSQLGVSEKFFKENALLSTTRFETCRDVYLSSKTTDPTLP